MNYYAKALKVIDSCKTPAHINVTQRYLSLMLDYLKLPEIEILLIKFYRRKISIYYWGE